MLDLLPNKEIAYKEFAKELILRKEEILVIKDVHYLMHRRIITDKNTYYCVYKTDFFRSFSIKFPNERGLGESLNQECMEEAVKKGAILIFIYKFHGVYKILSKYFKEYSEANNLIREQEKGNMHHWNYHTGNRVVQHEITCCVPVHLLTKF